jgi:2-dehydro-3-deoxyphosphogluconate aldolase/(4S)-4-hydroxy-2-oxoglutarate aldolase
MDAATERLEAAGVVPVITIEDAARAPGLGEALLAGGLPLAEITFRTDAAADAIAELRRAVPDVLVGAGTVLDADTVDRALGAGAEFIVAPGLNRAVVQRCHERDVAVIPGVATPTEIEAALALGLRLVKLFPAEALGGLPYLQAIAAPYRGVRFVPTGGIGPANLDAWLANPAVAACGGSWIATADDIRDGRWDEVAAKAAQAVAIAAAARGQERSTSATRR